MKEDWINGKLCNLGDETRIELGPQVIELECSDENLSNAITSPHYRIGGRDAYGRVIGFDALPDEVREATDISMGVINKGEQMACVDWRSKHVPPVWKVYKIKDERFTKIAEFEDKDEALNYARRGL